MLADLATAGESVVAADGGRYGRGNHRFATSTNQEPLLAEAGEAGGLRSLALEVRLVADVALVGAPNAGEIHAAGGSEQSEAEDSRLPLHHSGPGALG